MTPFLSMHRMKTLFRFIADAIYPPRCPLCSVFIDGQGPCASCAPQLQPLDTNALFPSLRKIWFTRLRSRFAYEGPLRNALHRFKYGEGFDLCSYFASELVEESRKFDFDLIIPAPMHPKRFRLRGFNHAALIAQALGKRLKTAVDLSSLERVEDRVPQVGLERSERIENLKGAFAVRKRGEMRVADKKILLIDDIATTGATANESSHALIKAGADSVSVLTIARAL